MHVERHELAKAAERLRAVMDHSEDEQLRVVARLRLARVLLADNKADDALAVVQKAPDGAFAARYDEVRGDGLFAKGEKGSALDAYRAALTAGESGMVDDGQLQLKIQSLAAAAPVAATPAPTVTPKPTPTSASTSAPAPAHSPTPTPAQNPAAKAQTSGSTHK